MTGSSKAHWEYLESKVTSAFIEILLQIGYMYSIVYRGILGNTWNQDEWLHPIVYKYKYNCVENTNRLEGTGNTWNQDE